jgi:hypothetical protein
LLTSGTAFFINTATGTGNFAGTSSPVGDFNTLFRARKNIKFSKFTSGSLVWLFAIILPALFVERFKINVFMTLFEFHRLENSASFFSIFLPDWEFYAWLIAANDDSVFAAIFGFPSSHKVFDVFFNSVSWGGKIVMVVTVKVTAKTGKFAFVFGGGLDVDGVTVPGEPVTVTGDG